MPIRPENRHRYPPDWALRSHFVRFMRARGCCEWCGVPHGWEVWRHPDNHRAWWARCELEPAGHRVRQTCAEVRLDPPTNFAGPVRIVLTCAHVYDDRPEAASLLNLAALCQLCHNRHDAQARQERRRARLLRESGQGDLFRPPPGDAAGPSLTRESAAPYEASAGELSRAAAGDLYNG